MKLLNMDLLLSPYNWATVLLMGIFGLAFLALLFPSDETE